MQILNKIAVSKTEPPFTDCLWIKPVKGGIALYSFEGGWTPLLIVNDMGTATPSDDAVIDVANIPSIESLAQNVKEEVERQISVHDVNVGDTHNTATGDSEEYPDVNVFG